VAGVDGTCIEAAVGVGRSGGGSGPGDGRPAAGSRSPHEMQNVRPAGFERPQTAQVGPVVAIDGPGDGWAAAGGTAAALGVVGASGTGTAAAGVGPDSAGLELAGAPATAGVPASSAANSRNAPQFPQNASPAAFDAPHFGQIIRFALASVGGWFRAA
jgi:hypothetical protein